MTRINRETAMLIGNEGLYLLVQMMGVDDHFSTAGSLKTADQVGQQRTTAYGEQWFRRMICIGP